MFPIGKLSDSSDPTITDPKNAFSKDGQGNYPNFSSNEPPEQQFSYHDRYHPEVPHVDTEDVPLLFGEKVLRTCKEVTYLCPYTQPIKGNLYLTSYKLYFSAEVPKKEQLNTFEIALGNLNRVEKVGGVSSRGENSYGIEIFCKDVRKYKFANNPEKHSRREFFDELLQVAFPITKKVLPFAFHYTERFPEDGWTVYEPIRELTRMGVPNESWKITRMNEQYGLCDSYPSVWAIPTVAEDVDVRAVCNFRSRNRLPILSWLHPYSHASITRSAQPLVGVASRRSRDDEKYLNYILEANAQAHKLYVMDARPNANAVANKAKGGGYEPEDAYPNIELIFLDIHNIHVMRESLRKLKDECYPGLETSKWLSAIESTRWLEHLKCIISGAIRIVDKIETNKTSVLVHCSDGWDRTAQLTSLAMLLLDPYYRTLKGFEVLIEKEWLSFGHKFQHRIGHGDDRHSDADRSPIFLQWVDTVYQVTTQFPYDFEFNEYFLLTILEHLYSCLYGTFLYNNERERWSNDVKRKTVSLWSMINSKMDIYLNPYYCEELAMKPPGKVLLPSPYIKQLKVWKGYFCQWNPRTRPNPPIWTGYPRLLHIRANLEKKVKELRIEAEKRNNQTLHAFQT